MELRWLSYSEMAEAMGLTRESARVLARTKHWSRRPGNDGKVRVGVPEEEISARSPPPEETDDESRKPPRKPPRSAPRSASGSPPGAPPGGEEAPPALALEIAVLRVRCAGLEATVEDLKAERNRWAAQAEALARRPWIRWPWSRTL